jgi:hypothetical protein
MVCASLDKKHDPFCALWCHICYTLHSQVEGQYLQISFEDIVINKIWRYPSSINLCISQVYLHYFVFYLHIGGKKITGNPTWAIPIMAFMRKA